MGNVKTTLITVCKCHNAYTKTHSHPDQYEDLSLDFK
jgi:hypothetical protein